MCRVGRACPWHTLRNFLLLPGAESEFQDCRVDPGLPCTLVEMKTDKPLGRKAGKQRAICKLSWLSFKCIQKQTGALLKKFPPLRAVGHGVHSCIISLAVAPKATINIRLLQENPQRFPVSYGSR